MLMPVNVQVPLLLIRPPIVKVVVPAAVCTSSIRLPAFVRPPGEAVLAWPPPAARRSERVVIVEPLMVDPLSPVKLTRQPALSPLWVAENEMVTSTVCAPVTVIDG